MNRVIYVAGVNRRHMAEQVDECPFWLLSATLLRKYPSWLSSYISKRNVMWDPGTFSADAISYQGYRSFIDRYIRSKDSYLQYDEIGDAEITAFYLRDMRKRGYDPIPILQGEANELLTNEKLVAIGGLVPMTDDIRARYLDSIFYGNVVTAKIHLLGMIKHEWFAPYQGAVRGDNTSWIPRSEWNRKKTIDEWMKEYGDQWVPFQPRSHIQTSLRWD